MKWTLLLALACGVSPEDHLESARKNLQSGQYDPAINDAVQGLQASPDDKTAWGLELVVLEAYARSGKATETTAKIEGLATAHPDRVTPALYRSTADQLTNAGHSAEAIGVLDLGHKRFPDDAAINEAIAKAIESSKAGTDPEALKRLQTLGYVE